MTTKIYPVIHHRDDDTTFDQAATAHEAGADGVFLISHDDRDDEVADILQRWTAESGLPPKFRVGVNFLGWGNLHALEIAVKVGAQMIWYDAPGCSSQGLSTEGAQLVEHLRRLKAAGQLAPEVFASVAFKHQPVDQVPSAAAALARLQGWIPTTSGPATGEPPPLQKVVDMAGNGVLAIASGMSPENVAPFVSHLSHILVATGVSRDFHHFDFERLRAFVGAVRTADAAEGASV
ncbi:BtpA/SgcQ family protein [Acidovorax sp. Root219]|uniref:BtpA/SgcQ family protein n=1 Tax=Acidovorax sp. Root219 TaxID=1736493 RepID=UPI0007107DA8|nr:BtpA/SgcQ family protein [Acidovorax sp. Root219]KRC36274.1 hypothetical protein ASE28_01710 [Acidovorax sp. Root219]